MKAFKKIWIRNINRCAEGGNGMNGDQPITMTKNIFTVAAHLGCARLLNATSPTKKRMDEYLLQECWQTTENQFFVWVREFCKTQPRGMNLEICISHPATRVRASRRVKWDFMLCFSPSELFLSLLNSCPTYWYVVPLHQQCGFRTCTEKYTENNVHPCKQAYFKYCGLTKTWPCFWLWRQTVIKNVQKRVDSYTLADWNSKQCLILVGVSGCFCKAAV